MIYILGLLITLILKSTCIEVNFEAGDSGFFLKHYRQPPTETFVQYKNGSYMKEKVPHDIVLSTDRFTVTETNQPVSIRASYGPFSTKQTVPARYIVPEVSGVNKDYQNNTTAALYDLQNSNLHLDISAHLVRTSIPQDSPVLRVMFHAGADPTGHLQRQKVCVSLHVSLGGSDAVKGRCIPDGEDGVCVAEVLIPTNWWPNPQNINNVNSAQKVPTRHVQVAYSVFEPPLKNPEHCEPKVQVQPLTPFAEVGLVPPLSNYKEKFADDVLSIFLPNSPLYPLSKLYVPVFLRQPKANRISTVIMRARIKTGFKILGAKASSDSWSISLEKESPKYVICKVTAFKIEEKQKMTSFANSSQIIEGTFPIFSWLFEVTNDVNGAVDYGKIVFSVNYVYSQPIKELNNESTNHVKKKIIAKYEINKDDIQAVLPMAKNWELINTAVLTGRQVAQAMKVFIVSEAGKIADVTLQSFCHAEDESVIKVSSSCSSVYVDGSEIRGSSNASIIVKYGTYLGLAKFVVWMPEFPLEVYLSDFRLSQIKGWKILDDAQNLYGKKFRRRKKRSAYLKPKNDSVFNPDQMEKHVCKARYQQSSVEVYSRFIAIDQNSGRISYFISRRTSLRVTDIVQPLLRVSDPKVANLQGRVLQGKSMGRAEVQVLSPITGRVIGAKEVRVGSDKISLTKINVRVISGLQLSIYPDNSVTNGYLAETSVTQKLTAQYQEGLLDIDLEFSDGTKTPLRDVAVDDYVLLVESMDSEIVAFAPMLASHHPRVIAVGEGHGRLLRVSMLLAEDCRMRRSFANTQNLKSLNSPLASALAFVEVDFNNLETITQHDTVQNDGIVNKDKSVLRNIEDLSDIIGIPIKDSSYGRGTYIDSHRFRDSFHRNNDIYMKKKGIMTSVEFGIFVLLTAFCFAIVIFVITCVVYASKFRTMSVDHTSDTEHTKSPHKLSQNDVCTNAHDWVWLGRSTMEKSIANRDDLDTSARHFQIKITDNPIENFSNIKMSHRDSVHGKEERSLKNNQHDTSYKPPVPPHRNLSTQLFDDNVKVGNPSAALCSNGNRVPIISNVGNEDNNKLSISSVKKHNAELLVDFPKNCKLNAFQFDNTLPTHQANKGERSKRASVVGNPMFANNIAADSEPEQNLSFDCLDMDYEQIMHYFDNLKESNA